MIDHPAFAYANLERAIEGLGSAKKLLRSSTIGPYLFPGVPPEYSNWKDEQRAWLNDVALLNLSFHMTSLYLSGSDVLKFLKYVSCNKFGDFGPGRGKQLILANHQGELIADCILFYTSDGRFRMSGSPVASDWVQYQAETCGMDVNADRDDSVQFREGDPRLYVYQIQGPHSASLMKDVCDGDFPEIKFFRIGEFQIAGKPVQALRHGMAGVPGFELFGPWADHEVIMDALEKAGAKYKMRKVGAMAYPSTCLESGWLALPCPAIYTSPEAKGYREWLTPFHIETIGSIGGSFDPDDISDYYLDPVEVGYGKFIDTENAGCIGHAALLKKLADQKRTKVTLVWDSQDVTDAINASLFDDDRPAKYMDMPLSIYSTFQYDTVVKDGKTVGVSTYCGVSANANKMLSIAILGIEHAKPGTEVEILWGEPDSIKPVVERNVIRRIRARVATIPYFDKSNKTF
jgi:vanillate/3-O-methylgallate O-demethylase